MPATVAHYLIERELGRGGMGVVLLARDTRLGRRVAIKALPDLFAKDPVRRSRFDRESRVLAAINHPNVAAIYGIEEAEGACYLVLELADGPTLAERLRPATPADPAPLPLHEALDIARQVAAGLEAAHRHSIIHRDLKPANIKLRPDGVVKILDFGIAAGGETASSDDATLVAGPPGSFTREGAILGTPGYMSPEQARGWTVGPASDCWSFGCVLYECLTGRVAFDGDTDADRMAATLMGQPEWSRLEAAAPTPIVELVRRCLVREAAQRLAAMAQAAEILGAVTGSGAPARVTRPAAPRAPVPPLPLPPDPGPLIGRARELPAVHAALADAHLVTITGVAGSGRTRLALHAAQAAAGRTACWCALAPLDDPAYVRAAAIRAVGRPPPGPPALLVLDGCDHAPAACADAVAAWLASSPDARALATARDPLGLAGERTVDLGSLEAPDPDLGGRFEAAALLVARARRAAASFAPTPDDAARIARLCRLIGGLPFALELAGAAAASMAAPRLAELIEQRFRVMGVGPAASAEQRQAGVISWRVALLNEAERTLLRRLVLFAGGATAGPLAAVCGADASMAHAQSEALFPGPPTPMESRCLEMLHALERTGLVRVDHAAQPRPERARWSVPAPVRPHVTGLADSADAAAAERFAEFHARLGQAILPRLDGAAGAAWRTRLQDESANIHAAARVASAATRLTPVLEAIRSAG